MTKNYVNNKQMFNVLKDYIERSKTAKESGTEAPKIPDYIGECIYQIANRLASKKNFSGYSYKEEMISDGIENSIMYLHNFNPEKSNNPFAYFTQIIKFAFIRRIDKEKKQHYIKIKNYYRLNMDEDMNAGYTKSSRQVNPNSVSSRGSKQLNEITGKFVEDYEKRLTEKKKKVKMKSTNTVNNFLSDAK
jgi:hypothetical protein